MTRGTVPLTVVVACDDDDARERMRAALSAEDGVTVTAAVSTTGMVSTTARLAPVALVVLAPRPRQVDLARIRSLTRTPQKGRPAVIALLVDAPATVEPRALQSGANLVRPLTTGPAELVAHLRYLRTEAR